MKTIRFAAVVTSVLLSLMIGIYAQTSSSNYHHLFWAILPLVVQDLVIISLVCLSKEKSKIWLVVMPAILGFASFVEIACRVWLGFRLI